MKRSSGIFSIILLIMAFSLTAAATDRGNESELLRSFRKAYNVNIGVRELVEKNRDLLPGEIKGLIAESHSKDLSADERAQKQYMAETMARVYNKITGDISYFIEVKREILNSRLQAPVNTADPKGIHIIEVLPVSVNEKNVFKPDNIVIQAGETIRWVNNASIAQKLTSMPLIGRQVLFTPNIEPDGTWAHHFKEPGEYYYFGYNQRSMVGKITVLPATQDNMWEERDFSGAEQKEGGQ